ncbi:uncharacterized protein N7479_006609 [Penicillium vulpinum]|nr:uncharacterized protein N7479_006609 [Penicillium vulpinum]KAJ5959459.1 hypothetical protein N7479_006609 [Penicillium vulpinum]
MALFFLDNVPPELLDAMTISGWESMLRSCERDAYLRSLPSPWRNPQIAQIILDKVNLKTNLATTTALERANLLAVAAETGNMSLTQLLLDRGCRPILSQMLHTPVSRAVNNGHAKIIETFLRCPDYPVSQLDVASAAEKGETTTVLTLLKKVKRKDFKSFAQVALNAASYPDKFVPMMEDVFLDVLTKKDTMTLVSMAISSNGPQISRLGHLEAMKFLLEKGDKQPFDKIPYYFEIIRRRSKGSTSFLEHAAAVCPVTQFQAALAQWNLVLDPENDLCKAALVAAALLKKVEILQLFIDKGFDVNSSYLHRGKFSPLLHLVVETLEDENGEVIGVDDEHARIRQPKQPKRHPWLDHIHPHASIQLLIEHGAKIDQVDSNGRTALFLTTERRTLFLTKELLRLGANPVLSGPGKPSPLELAISQGQPKYVKAFLEAMEARSIVCDNFVSLIPDSLPVETLPNRASGERFSVPSGYRLSQRRMLARDGQMGPTKTLPAPCAEAPRQPTLSWEDISTDEEIWREGLRNSEDNLISIWSPTEDDDCISDLRWVRFFITKAMTQYHWRTMYPVPV